MKYFLLRTPQFYMLVKESTLKEVGDLGKCDGAKYSSLRKICSRLEGMSPDDVVDFSHMAFGDNSSLEQEKLETAYRKSREKRSAVQAC